jgi:signal transduction histidine kinase
MGAWLTSMYQRYGARYVVACHAAVAIQVLVLVVPAAAFFPSRYEGLTVQQSLAFLLLADGLALIVFAVAFLAVGRGLQSLLVWSRERSEEHVEGARAFAFDGPRRTGYISMALAAPLAPVAVALLASPHHHTTVLDWLELTIGALAAVVLSGLNAWFTLDVLLRPARAALAHSPQGRRRRTSLVARLALVIPTATWLAGTAVGYLTTNRARAGAGHLLVVYGIALAGAALCLIVLAPLFVGGFVSPIRDLIRVTRAVARGRLDTRAAVTTTDELGELATSFNHMLDELRATRARIVAASDLARREVERDLHDGAQQRLVLLKLKLGLLARDPGRRELIGELGDDIELALEELRDLARGIYPALLENEGLRGALSEAANRAAIPTELDCDGAGRYPPEVEAAVYFCCLEALQNAAKHAGDHARASVRVTAGEGQLRFEVVDDGAGFDPTGIPASSGLQNMTDRIGALGGELRVDSSPGTGTTVKAAIPLGG